MNVKPFLLLGKKVIPEIHLRQPGLSNRASGAYTKNKGEYNNLKKQETQYMLICEKKCETKPAWYG